MQAVSGFIRWVRGHPPHRVTRVMGQSSSHITDTDHLLAGSRVTAQGRPNRTASSSTSSFNFPAQVSPGLFAQMSTLRYVFSFARRAVSAVPERREKRPLLNLVLASFLFAMTRGSSSRVVSLLPLLPLLALVPRPVLIALLVSLFGVSFLIPVLLGFIIFCILFTTVLSL
eukprot:gnl/MRDRNA2_/MRDRNA2_139322_c0_seq1.p1 gnl/MRDRNA2_/MRDRNA2_139322_c0~~gnl/MRDRNA2_/MRDRNA2_139322_c0_seq1.p1  ORF type:complete len:187 (+),score=12.43 gnl/MRDRNA2_/MRDRNA2_139322_c0_seq1:49-561(+)